MAYEDDVMRVGHERGWLGHPGPNWELARPKEETQAARARGSMRAAYQWQWKIKQMLDPNDVADEKSYKTLEPKKET